MRMRNRRVGLAFIALALAAPVGVRAQEPADEVLSHYRAALELEAAGDAARASEAYAQVLLLDPEHLAARRALGYERVNGAWLAGDELKRARALLLETAVSSRCLSPPTQVSSRCLTPPTQVSGESGGVSRWGQAPTMQVLIARAFRAPEARVREAAVLELKARALPGTQAAFTRALASAESTTRVRAAQALGLLGDAAALQALITSWEGRSGQGPRSHFAQTAQSSYIQDFDVEVASTSFIADPIVGVIQSGVVLDMRVLGTVQTIATPELLAYRGALVRLLGTDLDPTVAPWSVWRRKHAPKPAPATPETRDPARAPADQP